MKEVQVAEARAFYGFQIAIENIRHFPCCLPLSRLLRSSATVTFVCRYRRELHLSLLFVAAAAAVIVMDYAPTEDGDRRSVGVRGGGWRNTAAEERGTEEDAFDK
ncbi:unnamed protein product [Linum trigynum]|uniref:Uncharacterized protein n=1 Tax=Linum trigynum TaxID=586398 RepID=A0AAV2DRB9_9ROSI